MTDDDRAPARPPTRATPRGRKAPDDASDAHGERRFLVEEASAGQRLDHFVAQCLGESAAAARRLIAAGYVRVGGDTFRKGTRLTSGMTISVAPGISREGPIVADPTVALSIVFKDRYLVAIDKPPGQPSHPLRAGERGTAANGIVARFPECAQASVDPREGGLAHRLDNGTSGVLIAGRSRDTWLGLRGALTADDCEKTYWCEVWGAPPDVGKNEREIGRRGRRAAVVRVGGGRGAGPARTNWRVLQRRGETALLEARLHAGRAHQVRAHLADAGFPLVGDDRYGGLRTRASALQVDSARLHLHAASVRFRHPQTGELVVIEAPPPEWAIMR